MSDDIRAGDVVVCIGSNPDCPDGCSPFPSALSRTFRVTAVFLEAGWQVPGLTLAGGPGCDDGIPWCSCAFRKIDAADDKFIADMRALKPIPVAAGYGQKVVVR